MTFDAPLLLFLAPVLGAGARLRRLARRAAAGSGWRGAGRPRSAGWRGPAAAGRPLVLGLVGARWRSWRWPARAGAGPRSQTETRALSLVFAVDISRSMLAEDVAPNRLQRAVREARRLIQDLEGDRLGLIAFAGRSYILAPLTVDGGAIRMYLDALDPDLASEGGTSLAARARPGRRAPRRRRPTRPTGCWSCSPTARPTTRCPKSWPQAEALKDAGVRLIVVAEGGAHCRPASRSATRPAP